MSILASIDRRLRIRASLQDHVTTRPSLWFTPGFHLAPADAQQAGDAVRAIQTKSAFFAGVRLTADELRMLRSAMEDAYAGRRADLTLSVNPRTGIAQIHDPLKLHPVLVRLASDPFLCGIAERYLRRRIFLADVDMRRVPPMEMSELDRRAGTKAIGTTSSHWHRDIRGRQVKVMVYLTEVGEEDSNFAFVPGTHQGHHVRPRTIEESRFTDEWIRAEGLVPVECYGPSGTAMVFDTNLIHRLRRKATGAVRDSITFYYTPGQELRVLGVDAVAAAALPEPGRMIFRGRRSSEG